MDVILKEIKSMNKLQKITFFALAAISVFFLASFDKSKTNNNVPTQALSYLHYRIISGSYSAELESSINYYLKDGWVPIGGVVIEGDSFYQAIAK